MDWNQIESSWLAMTRKVRLEWAARGRAAAEKPRAPEAPAQPGRATAARPFAIAGKVSGKIAGSAPAEAEPPVRDDRKKALSH